jgi:hypothetical protein
MGLVRPPPGFGTHGFRSLVNQFYVRRVVKRF